MGTFSALAGAQITGDRILVGSGLAGNGSVSIAGDGTVASTVVQLSLIGGGRLSAGDWGMGTMTASAGALVDATSNAGACTGSTFCGVDVGGFAWANGILTLTGLGVYRGIGGGDKGGRAPRNCAARARKTAAWH